MPGSCRTITFVRSRGRLIAQHTAADVNRVLQLCARMENGFEALATGALIDEYEEMKTLKIRSLDKGWCDKDAMMLHAAFQLLVDFVEQEKPDKVIDWSACPLHKQAWKEIRSLYRWWRRTRPARRDPLDEEGLKRPPMLWEDIPGSDCKRLVQYDKKDYPEYERAFRKSVRLEKAWEDEDQKNFHRLVEIRGFLWT